MISFHNYGFSRINRRSYIEAQQFLMTEFNFDHIVLLAKIAKNKIDKLHIEVCTQLQTRSIHNQRRLALKALQGKIGKILIQLKAVQNSLTSYVREDIYSDDKPIRSWIAAIEVCIQCHRQIKQIEHFIKQSENKI